MPGPDLPGPDLPGLLIAAARSGGGKTVLTAGLIRALAKKGRRVVPAKTGPDYIDPAFHAAAAGRAAISLDSWAMRPSTLDALAAGMRGDLAVVEGVMGLFDGATLATPAPLADGSTASLALRFGWPVVLVLDVPGQGASVAAVARGFATHRPGVEVAAMVLNRTAGARHEAALRAALAETLPAIPVIGAVPRDARLELPHRHLGLVQAREHATLDAFLNAAADVVSAHVDLAALEALARPARLPAAPCTATKAAGLLPPPGQRVAVAADEAFAFAYPALLAGWRAAGAEILPFSPLADQGPDTAADAVYLPGGYPELHAGALAAADGFRSGMAAAAARGAWIWGECGGYMTLGESLEDADGVSHAMLGLLPLRSSFARRRLHLGYRRAEVLHALPFLPAGAVVRGHEFHYASVLADSGAGAAPLLRCADSLGETKGDSGLVRGRVAGSFLHLIDQE